MRLTHVNGPNDLVNDALTQIEINIFLRSGAAASSTADELRVVKQRIRTGEDFDCIASLVAVYSRFTDSINTLLREHLSELVDIGSANPEYVSLNPARWASSSNPAQWASDFLRPHVFDIMESAERIFFQDYISLLDDQEETTVSLRTDL